MTYDVNLWGSAPGTNDDCWAEPQDDPCRECGESADDGEGWDGLCGNCADREEE